MWYHDTHRMLVSFHLVFSTRRPGTVSVDVHVFCIECAHRIVHIIIFSLDHISSLLESVFSFLFSACLDIRYWFLQSICDVASMSACILSWYFITDTTCHYSLFYLLFAHHAIRCISEYLINATISFMRVLDSFRFSFTLHETPLATEYHTFVTVHDTIEYLMETNIWWKHQCCELSLGHAADKISEEWSSKWINYKSHLISEVREFDNFDSGLTREWLKCKVQHWLSGWSPAIDIMSHM